MAMSCTRFRRLNIVNSTIGIMGSRGFVAGALSKKGSKGGGGDAPKASVLTKETKSTAVFEANILKEATDPKILLDSEYPGWLWHLLDKQPPLSELRRRGTETLPYGKLKFVKLDNRARIKDNNAVRAKN